MPAHTIAGLIERRIQADPSATALLAGGLPPLSYADLGQLVERVARALTAQGARRDDRVAIVLPNGPAMAAACLAVSMRATAVPLNPEYQAGELEEILTRSRVRLLITAEGNGAPREVARALGIQGLHLIEASEDGAGCFHMRPTGAPVAHGAHQDGPALPDDVAFLLLTSGSTAQPRLVPLTHRNVTASARNVARSLALGAEDRCLNMMPMFHVGALVDLLLAPLSVGGSVVCASSVSAGRFFDCLRDHRPTWYQGVPTMLQDILDQVRLGADTSGASSLRFVRSVSAPLPERVRRDFEQRLQLPVIEIYGMTETAGLITSDPLPPAIRKPGTVGCAAGPEIAIVDENGNPLGAGELGEVVVRGDNVTAGYEDDVEERSRSFIGEWLRTGDLGLVDDDGYLHLKGRIKEIINRGGEKISPREVDALLHDHPAVLEAATFAIPHESLGEEVAAAVVVRAGATLDEAELLEALSARLAYYKVPRRVFTLDALPRSPGGKLARHALTERFGGADAAGDRAHHVAPQSPLARVLAEIWQETLGVSPIGIHDDFFDLGGDSLGAATFAVTLERKTGRQVDVSAIFDAPTIAELELLLESGAAGGDARIEADLSPATSAEVMPPSLHRWIAERMAGWKGVRATPDALLVGRNTFGSRQPLFWCVQVPSELSQLHEHIDGDQPLYGMRSLYRLRNKNPALCPTLEGHRYGLRLRYPKTVRIQWSHQCRF